MNRTFPLHELHASLFAWWLKNGRVLPWRRKDENLIDAAAQPVVGSRGIDLSVHQVREVAFSQYMAHELRRDPYRVVVAELMLQQTQVDRVLPKYLDWMKQWPTIHDLAKAELSEVIIFWKGLGYNRRARFLWMLAKKIVEGCLGVWPTTEAELLELPGLGKYTARAVMSFAFGQEVAVVDTNVKRVLRRILDGSETSAAPELSEKEWFARADAVLPPGQADPWNQLIMDLGAIVCPAKVPKCEICPVSHLCKAQQFALSKDFVTYREYLQANPPQKKAGNKTLRFEDTDRFFRGRLMDLLRDSQMSEDALWRTLTQDYGLVERERFEKLIFGLQKEGMICKELDIIKLA